MNSDILIKVLRKGKWASLLLGAVMYIATESSFGNKISILLSLIATISFYIIVKNEETRQIGGSIARIIENAINKVDIIQSIVEIKRIRRGMIARIYLINAKEKEVLFHKAISSSLNGSKYRKYILMIQMTSMDTIEDLKRTQHIMNEQLLDAIMSNHKKTDSVEKDRNDRERDRNRKS